MTLLLKEILTTQGVRDILIARGKIAAVAPELDAVEPDRIIHGQKKAAVPGLINGHTHSPMTLLRGYGDDMALFPWLQERIWPAEARMTDEDFYWGARLACLEMLRSGTVAFQDMYFQPHILAQAAADAGMKALINFSVIDRGDPERGEQLCQECAQFFDALPQLSNRIRFNLAAHSIYATSRESLLWLNSFARERGLSLHIHLAETRREYEDALNEHGLSPTAYLQDLGILGPHIIAAHVLHTDERDLDILARHDVKIIHNPGSNMKLSSGKALPVKKMLERGLTIGIGTDGASSNNSLDMFDEMKLTALLQKQETGDPQSLSAAETFRMATEGSARALGLASGVIREGAPADIIIVDLQRPEMVPCTNLLSNLVYAAGGACVDSVICDGELLMENRWIQGERKILDKAAEKAERLTR